MGETADFLTDREIEVSLLSNFFHYSVDGAFILKESGGFRLVVQKQGAVVCKEAFGALEEARGAFLDLFGYNDDEITRYIKPVWTGFSKPKELALKPHVQLVMEYALGSIQGMP